MFRLAAKARRKVAAQRVLSTGAEVSTLTIVSLSDHASTSTLVVAAERDSASPLGVNESQRLFEQLQAERSDAEEGYRGARKKKVFADIRAVQAFYRMGGFSNAFLADLAASAGLNANERPETTYFTLLGGYSATTTPAARRALQKAASEDASFAKALVAKHGVDELLTTDAETLLDEVDGAGGKTAYTRKYKPQDASRAAPEAADKSSDANAAAFSAIAERALQAPTLAKLDGASVPVALPGRIFDAVCLVGDDGCAFQ